MFSSIRCPQCTAEQDGYLVSTNPTAGPDTDTDWRCVHCSKNQKAQFVNAVTQSIGEELVSLEKGSVEACQAFIRNIHIDINIHQMTGNIRSHFPAQLLIHGH